MRLVIDGVEYTTDEEIRLEKNRKHDIAAVVDRLVIKPDIRVVWPRVWNWHLKKPTAWP